MRELKYPVFIFVLIIVATALLKAEEGLKKIVVSKDGSRLETSDGKPFVPWGINYFRPEMGWAPKIWRMFDPETTRMDFQRIKKMGGNCVRVFLTYNEFLTLPDKVNESGLKKLDEFLKIAEETGIYVHPTGPDHWEGLPDWARGDRICDDKVLRALELFWQTIAERYKGRNVLFAYDLLNEPSVPWNSPQLILKWKDWISIKY
ncbi:MAG: cellulase family glycosylhydrolase, partial [Verrucomicrobiia bacterium]